MHAIVVAEPGGPEVMQWAEVADPVPGPGEVLIDITATSVNRADLLQRQGFYPPPPGASDLLGLECSGTISALGEGVTHRKVGDEVCALLAGGGYAQKVAVPVEQVMSVPSGMSLIDAGSIAEIACTVWSNLVMTAHLAEGELVLIHGGGSGIGTHAIQVARALGARVAVTAGSQAKLTQCEALGAEILIDYRQQDFAEVIKAETGGKGADVILDIMGASYLDRNVRTLARNGRLVIIGLQGGVKAELDINALLRKNASIHPTSLRGRPVFEKGAICAQVEARVWPLIAAGIITPVVDRVVPITEAPEAHRLIADGAVTGKLGLQVR